MRINVKYHTELLSHDFRVIPKENLKINSGSKIQNTKKTNSTIVFIRINYLFNPDY